MDTASGLSECMSPEQKAEVLEWALAEFEKLNKSSLAKMCSADLGFIWPSLMIWGRYSNPRELLSYSKTFWRIEGGLEIPDPHHGPLLQMGAAMGRSMPIPTESRKMNANPISYTK